MPEKNTENSMERTAQSVVSSMFYLNVDVHCCAPSLFFLFARVCMCMFRLVHQNQNECNGTESNREVCIHFIQMHTKIWLCTRTGHYPYSEVLFFLMLVDFVVVYFHYLVQVGAFKPFKSWILYKHNLAIHLNFGFCLGILFGQSPVYDSSFGGAFVFAFAAKQ